MSLPSRGLCVCPDIVATITRFGVGEALLVAKRTNLRVNTDQPPP